MKLTKGKISKLYKKKNQSFKKKRNRNKNENSYYNTFRRQKSIDFSRKTLKNIHLKNKYEYNQGGGGEVVVGQIYKKADSTDTYEVTKLGPPIILQNTINSSDTKPFENETEILGNGYVLQNLPPGDSKLLNPESESESESESEPVTRLEQDIKQFDVLKKITSEKTYIMILFDDKPQKKYICLTNRTGSDQPGAKISIEIFSYTEEELKKFKKTAPDERELEFIKDCFLFTFYKIQEPIIRKKWCFYNILLSAVNDKLDLNQLKTLFEKDFFERFLESIITKDSNFVQENTDNLKPYGVDYPKIMHYIITQLIILYVTNIHDLYTKISDEMRTIQNSGTSGVEPLTEQQTRDFMKSQKIIEKYGEDFDKNVTMYTFLSEQILPLIGSVDWSDKFKDSIFDIKAAISQKKDIMDLYKGLVEKIYTSNTSSFNSFIADELSLLNTVCKEMFDKLNDPSTSRAQDLKELIPIFHKYVEVRDYLNSIKDKLDPTNIAQLDNCAETYNKVKAKYGIGNSGTGGEEGDGDGSGEGYGEEEGLKKDKPESEGEGEEGLKKDKPESEGEGEEGLKKDKPESEGEEEREGEGEGEEIINKPVQPMSTYNKEECNDTFNKFLICLSKILSENIINEMSSNGLTVNTNIEDEKLKEEDTSSPIKEEEEVTQEHLD